MTVLQELPAIKITSLQTNKLGKYFLSSMHLMKFQYILKINLIFSMLWIGAIMGQDWKPAFLPLEFDVPGISIEVPKGWYSFNNGSLKLVDELSSALLGKGNERDASMLVSLVDKQNIEDPNSSLLTIQFSPEVMLSQRDVAGATAAQKEVILEHWRTTGYDGLKNVAHFIRLVDGGEIIQTGSNWYAKIVMEVQMRQDLPKKTKEVFFHMSNKGVVMIGFTFLPEAKDKIIPIRNYVIESLRLDTIKRTK